MAKWSTLQYGIGTVKNSTPFSMSWNWFTEKDREVEFYLKMFENAAYKEDQREQCDS